MAHQNPDLHKKKEKKGLQICIWTDNPTNPTLMFHNCRRITEREHELRFRYDGVSTGKTSNAVFPKAGIVGYAIEHEEFELEGTLTNEAIGAPYGIGHATNPLARSKNKHTQDVGFNSSLSGLDSLMNQNIAEEINKRVAHGINNLKGGL